jgi:hypothetical protein
MERKDRWDSEALFEHLMTWPHEHTNADLASEFRRDGIVALEHMHLREHIHEAIDEAIGHLR